MEYQTNSLESIKRLEIEAIASILKEHGFSKKHAEKVSVYKIPLMVMINNDTCGVWEKGFLGYLNSEDNRSLQFDSRKINRKGKPMTSEDLGVFRDGQNTAQNLVTAVSYVLGINPENNKNIKPFVREFYRYAKITLEAVYSVNKE